MSTGERQTRAGWRAPALLLATALIAAVIGLLSSGAISGSQIVDPGALVRWGLPVASVLANLGAAITIGSFAAAAFLISPTAERAWRGSVTVGQWGAVAWALAAVSHAILGYASVWGRPLTAPNFGAELLIFFRGTELGVNYFWAAALAVLVSLFAVATASLPMALWTAVLGAIALVPVALTGHAAGAVAHNLAVSSQWLHLVPVALWVGPLLALVVVGQHLGDQLTPAVRRYSTMALWCYIAIVASGVLSALIRLNTPLELFTTPWGRLLLAKIVLFGGLGVAGWMHRERTIPQLGERPRLFWRLAIAELAVMGAAGGIAVALSSSAPPVPQSEVLDPSAVFALTSYPEPPFPTTLNWLTQWHPDPLYILGGTAAVVVYVRWMLQLRGRGITWSGWRTASWIVGWALFVWVTCGGPYVYGVVLFSSHMVMHMILVMGIPILFALAAPITLGLRAVRPRRDGSRGPREWVLAMLHSPYSRVWSHPIVAGANFAGSLFVFYYSPLITLALTTHVGHVLMVVHFTLAGYLFANAIVGIDPTADRPAFPIRLLVLFATMVFHAFFGLSLANMGTLLAPTYYGRLGLSWWVDALADQQMGGFITWGIGEAPVLILAIIITWQWIRADSKEATRLDRAADRDDDAALRAYNEMLAKRTES
ncbi:MAG: bifunctional copper resistance protein CopD/cytochrome c oxidase assembly protein [Ruaniaceae bacterium]|nr:bifunctional copper resistance protein CopD/cytochrome c oxidase assembly protein [Ruaniaceae bacterium]